MTLLYPGGQTKIPRVHKANADGKPLCGRRGDQFFRPRVAQDDARVTCKPCRSAIRKATAVSPPPPAAESAGAVVGASDLRAVAISLQSILRRGFQVVHSDPDCIGCEHCGHEWDNHDPGCEIGVVWKALDGWRTVSPTPGRAESPGADEARRG